MKKQLEQLYSISQNKYLYYKKISQYFVLVRTLVLMLYIGLIVEGIKRVEIKPYFGLLFITLTIIFGVICIYHNKIRLKEEKHKISQEIIEEYYKRINNEWYEFQDLGLDLIDTNNHFLFDLDIVGKNSLFQYLNIAKSEGGKRKLIEKLSNPQVTALNLQQDQQAIKELKDNLQFCINFQIMLRNIKGDLSKQCELFNQKTAPHMIVFIINLVSSIVTLLLGILTFFSIIDSSFFSLLALLQLSFAFIVDKMCSKEFDIIKKASFSFRHLSPIFRLLSEYTFDSVKLKELQFKVQKGQQTFSKLNKIYNLNSCRNHFLGYVLSNSLLPLNTYILYSFHKVREQSTEDLRNSIEAFEWIEALISLSVIGVCKENVSIPTLNDNIKLSFKDIQHPLLNEKECISNSFESQNGINIITGSNMSGKTSFMRTIGMNLILMYAGTYVNASCFQAPYMKIFTSMRVSDDIERGVSTFYGELLRIKDIIDYLDNELPFIVFIDEIFKGTNYNDRIYGAKQVIAKIKRETSIVFITTHDFELCNDKNISNYYFEEYYEDNRIKFDYKIKEGKCKTTNAKYLMKQLNII
ncbi:MAG: hypothetical protein U0L85_05955 [Bacilli bacterium]|nr:hypothetical protein [Bacilli bacterium]